MGKGSIICPLRSSFGIRHKKNMQVLKRFGVLEYVTILQVFAAPHPTPMHNVNGVCCG